MQLRLALGGLFAARCRTGSGSQCIIMRLVAHCHLLTNKKTAALFVFDRLGSDAGKSAIQNKQGARILQVEKGSTKVGFFLSAIYEIPIGVERVVRCVIARGLKVTATCSPGRKQG